MTERKLGPLLRRSFWAQWRNQDKGGKGRERGSRGNGAKPALLVKRGSKPRADREGREHCRSHPCDHLPGVVSADASEAPRRRPGNDEALGPTEDGAAGKQDRDGESRLAEES